MLVNPLNKEHKDPETIDLKAPRLARYLQTAWKEHQNTVYWVDFRLVQKKGFKFYQTRSNAIILYDALPAFCIPKAIKMETGEIKNEKVFASPRPPPKISFKDNWMKKWKQKLLDMMKPPNKPKKRPQIQLLEQGDLLRQNHRPVRVLRKSTNVSYLAVKAACTSSTRIRRRTCHSQIETHDEFNSENAFDRVVINFIKPGENMVRISRSWEICCKWR